MSLGHQFVKGEFEDILESFSEMLNLRVQQFKRFDGGWGSKETGTVYTLGHKDLSAYHMPC